MNVHMNVHMNDKVLSGKGLFQIWLNGENPPQ